MSDPRNPKNADWDFIPLEDWPTPRAGDLLVNDNVHGSVYLMLTNVTPTEYIGEWHVDWIRLSDRFTSTKVTFSWQRYRYLQLWRDGVRIR